MDNLPAKREENTESLQLSEGQTIHNETSVAIREDGIILPIDAGKAFQFISSEKVEKSTFAQKKAAVMAHVGKIHADKTHDYHNFSYASVHAITEKVQEACAMYGLALTAECVNAANPNMNDAGTDSKGKKKYLWMYNFQFTLTDADTGYSESATVPGGVEDTVPPYTKCLRAATKAYLTATFMIPIDDGPPPKREEELWSTLKKNMDGLVNYLSSAHDGEDMHAKAIKALGKIDKWPHILQPYGYAYVRSVQLEYDFQEAAEIIEMFRDNANPLDLPESLGEFTEAVCNRYPFALPFAECQSRD